MITRNRKAAGRFLWFCLGLLLPWSVAAAQEADPFAAEKARIRGIKLCGEYYYSDVSAEDAEAAILMARWLLVLEIQGQETGCEKVGDLLLDFCRYIRLKRNGSSADFRLHCERDSGGVAGGRHCPPCRRSGGGQGRYCRRWSGEPGSGDPSRYADRDGERYRKGGGPRYGVADGHRLGGCVCRSGVFAQYRTDFLLTGMEEGVLKSRVEKTMTDLLSESSLTQHEGRSVNMGAFRGRILPEAVTSLVALWETCPFRCMETEVIERCLKTPAGLQVCNIPLMMMPHNREAYLDDLYQEAVVNFDASGQISEFYFSIGLHLYSKVIRSNISVTDLRRRQIILDFVENFRTAYNRKDLPFLSQVFSNDALIITGKQLKAVKNDGGITLDKSFEYKRQTKAEYIAALDGVFTRNKTIWVIFDDIKVVKHPVKDYYYGVTLKQGWRSDTYSDVVYVFLLMDFKDDAHLMIHVRTWQPEKNTTTARKCPKTKCFRSPTSSVRRKSFQFVRSEIR